jgi:hypothetical protein
MEETKKDFRTGKKKRTMGIVGRLFFSSGRYKRGRVQGDVPNFMKPHRKPFFLFLRRKGCPYCEKAYSEWKKAAEEDGRLKMVDDDNVLECVKAAHKEVKTFPSFFLCLPGKKMKKIDIEERRRTKEEFLSIANTHLA